MLRLQAPLPERYTSASQGRAGRHDRRRQGRRSGPGSSFSGTTTSGTRSCAGPTPGATPSGSPGSPPSQSEAEFIVFCGVHFMAESADVLTGDHQQVLLPDLNAGCSMADMADIDQVEEAWDDLAAGRSTSTGVIPVTYMNSVRRPEGLRGPPRRCRLHVVQRPGRADLGPGERGGTGRRVLFFPDQHLGRNTGFELGYGADDMRVWNPRLALGGLYRP